jgi:hypothetical protein
VKTTLILICLILVTACASNQVEKLPDGETYKLHAKEMECIDVKPCQKMLPGLVKSRAVELCGTQKYYLFDCQVETSSTRKRDGTCLMRCGEPKDTTFKD